MNTRKIQPSESLTDKLLHAAEYERGISDQLIRGLVERLPKPDSIWPLDDRASWLRTAGIFDLVYKPGDGERGEISIVKDCRQHALTGFQPSRRRSVARKRLRTPERPEQ